MRLAYITFKFEKLQMVAQGWDPGFMCGASRPQSSLDSSWKWWCIIGHITPKYGFCVDFKTRYPVYYQESLYFEIAMKFLNHKTEMTSVKCFFLRWEDNMIISLYFVNIVS